jgi:hypothetical protein
MLAAPSSRPLPLYTHLREVLVWALAAAVDVLNFLSFGGGGKRGVLLGTQLPLGSLPIGERDCRPEGAGLVRGGEGMRCCRRGGLPHTAC